MTSTVLGMSERLNGRVVVAPPIRGDGRLIGRVIVYPEEEEITTYEVHICARDNAKHIVPDWHEILPRYPLYSRKQALLMLESMMQQEDLTVEGDYHQGHMVHYDGFAMSLTRSSFSYIIIKAGDTLPSSTDFRPFVDWCTGPRVLDRLNGQPYDFDRPQREEE